MADDGLGIGMLVMGIGVNGAVLDQMVEPALAKTDDLSAVRDHRMRYFLPNRRPELY